MDRNVCKKLSYLSLFFVLFFNMSYAHDKPHSDTKVWLSRYTPFFIDQLTDNISPSDASPGAVIAAKSKKSPDYYYHWVRDAGIATDALVVAYSQFAKDIYKKNHIRRKLFEYLDFSRKIQDQAAISNLGEPKFHVDGSPFNDAWGRPQNDGPALRAISLIHFADLLLEEGNEALVKEKLYNRELPATSPIKKDLEYVSHHWRDPSYDLWEEVKGTHFYTLMVQRRALIEGARLANRLDDKRASTWYLAQSRQIEAELEKFFDQSLGYFVPTLNRVAGADYKVSQLDTAVLLGLLHGDLNDGFLPWHDKRVLATIEKLIGSFSALYPINHVATIPGVAIGRYPEDRYAGTHFNGGNPWVLCTLAVAESLYRYADELKRLEHRQEAEVVSARADTFIERVRYHAHPNGTLDEQIDRYTGYMTSAADLTWNYAAMLTARQSIAK